MRTAEDTDSHRAGAAPGPVRGTEALGFLASLGPVLHATLDVDAIMQAVARQVLPAAADYCVFDLVADGGTVRRVALAHVSTGREALLQELRGFPPSLADRESPVAAVIASGRPRLVPEWGADDVPTVARGPEHARILRELGARSLLIVPVPTRDRVAGALSLVMADSARRYAAEDVALGQEIGVRLGIAIENALLHERLRATNDELRAAADEARGIVTSIADPFVVYDRDWRLRHANAAAAAVFLSGGRDPEAVVGRVLWELYPDIVGTTFEREMRRARDTGVPTTFEELYPARAAWSEVRCYPLPDGGLATTWRDVTTQRRAREALHVLSESSLRLGASLDYEATVASLAHVLVPGLADWCAVDLAGPDGRPQSLVVAHKDPARVEWARELNRRYPPDPSAPTGVPNVIRTGRAELYPEVPDELLERGAVDAEHLRLIREVGFSSAMVVPLRVGTRVLGAMTLVSAESGRHYTVEDLALAEELGRRAALAIEHARQYREVLEQRELLQQQAMELEMQAEELRNAQEELEITNEELRETNQALEQQRDRAEHAAAEHDVEHRRLLTVLEQSPMGIAIAEAPSGRLLFANRQVHTIFGRARLSEGVERYSEDWRGHHLDGRAIAPHEWPLARAVERGESTTGEVVTIVHSSGRRVDITINAAPVRDAAGTVIAGVAIFWDVTAKREAEAALRRAHEETAEANRAKAEFLARMSHELRTPLNAIGGYAQLLELGVRGALNAEQREDVARIQRSQRHLLSLINDVLNYAKLEAGRVEYDVRAVRLAGELGGLEPLVAPQIAAKALTYELVPVPEALAARTDPEKLRQILLNLLSNAVKFTPAGGRVRVEAAAQGDDVVVRVADTGIGIPADRLESVFEPFVQLDRTLTSPQEGTGLGLAISRDLARAMGGDLVAASAPGQGATFTLRLPRG